MYYPKYAPFLYIVMSCAVFRQKFCCFSFLFAPGVTEYVLQVWHGVGGSVDWKIARTVYFKQLIRCILRET